MSNEGRSYKSAFAILVLLFFIWGFITSLNDVLIPHLKGLFDLNYTQAMLVQFCFFGAYFIMSVPAGMLIDKVGYKMGAVFGLSAIGVGCLLFYPAAEMAMYPIFLAAMFVIGSGITVLQVAANPFVAALGHPDKASSRLNLSQGFNSLAHYISPKLGAAIILGAGAVTAAEKADAVKLPYVFLGLFVFLIALFFSRVKLPHIQPEGAKADSGVNVWSFPNLKWGVLAIFLYVGAEVSIGGFLVNYFGETKMGGLSEEDAGSLMANYWLFAMIGRFLGFAILMKVRSNTLLAFNAVAAIALICVSVFSEGEIARWSILLVGLFNSIMFPNIFTIAIRGLGELTSKASGLLVMAIFGGAIIPVAQGALADSIGVQMSFILPAVCYLYILWYANMKFQSKAA